MIAAPKPTPAAQVHLKSMAKKTPGFMFQEVPVTRSLGAVLKKVNNLTILSPFSAFSLFEQKG
jgi:hypothetical protein